MIQIQNFNFKNKSIRTLLINNEPWFVAKDVCLVLDIVNYRNPLIELDANQKGVASMDTLGGKQEMSIVNESGLYTIIFKSRKEEAIVFQKWVTSEVLPSIRKSGAYLSDKIDTELVRKLCDDIDSKDKLLLEAKPKVEFFDEVIDKEGAFNLRETAKLLNMKERLFFTFLYYIGFCYEDKSNKYMPTAVILKSGYSKVKIGKVFDDGRNKTQTLITSKGLDYLLKRRDKYSKDCAKI